jgi:hypothetical protein
VFYAWAVKSRETGRAYMGTQPASAKILLDRAIDAEQMSSIAASARTRPGVLEATGRLAGSLLSTRASGSVVIGCHALDGF